MATSWSEDAANTALNSLLATYTWVKLHTGSPGSAGTSNAAANTTRKQVTPTTAVAGAASNANALTWTSVGGSEDYTHVSLWTAVSGGTFGGSGTVTASPVVAGDTFVFNIGDLDFTLTLAS